jgi:hypothetical protein
MSILLQCPLPEAILNIDRPDCPFKMDQIVALIFQRRQAAAPFASADEMKSLAAWAPLFLATDRTKAVITPIITSWTFPPSEALVQGGNDNTTFNGIREYNGEGSVTAEGQMKNLEPRIKKQIMSIVPFGLSSAVGVSDLTVYFVNKDGVIFHNDLQGFPVYNARVGSRGSEGFNSPDTNAIGLDLAPNWDNELASVNPDFNPLIELSNDMDAAPAGE